MKLTPEQEKEKLEGEEIINQLLSTKPRTEEEQLESVKQRTTESIQNKSEVSEDDKAKAINRINDTIG